MPCTLDEIVSLYNKENEEKTSYYKVWDVMNTKKQFLLHQRMTWCDVSKKKIWQWAKPGIQSVYFGHECFTIFTAACYFNSTPGNAKISKSELKAVPVSIASNET